MAYQPGIPTGLVPLNQDYLNIQQNFTALDTQFKIDHSPLTGPGTPPNGYHTSIHLVPQTSITNTSGYGQLYSKTITDVNTDQAIFWNTGTGNRTVQMTVPIVPVSAATGYSFLPGGILMQWGTQSNLIPVTFPLAFTTLFIINITPIFVGGGVPTTTTVPCAKNPTTTGFTAQNNSGQTFNFYWTAIGN